MAHRQKRGNQHKSARKRLKFIDIFVSERRVGREGAGQPSSDTSKPDCTKSAPRLASLTNFPSFHVNLLDGVAEKQGPWLSKAWAPVRNALYKQKRFSQLRLNVADNSASKGPSDNACRHQNDLEGLPPLGKQILLDMSRKFLRKGHVLLSARSCPDCNSVKSVDTFRNISERISSMFRGIFIHMNAKEISRFTRRLVEGERAQQSLNHMAFARLRGAPGFLLLGSSASGTDMDHGENYKEPMPLLLAAYQNLVWKLFGQHVPDGDPHEQQQQNFPDREMLTSVQDFFIYTEFEGKKVFDELDRDADGKLTVDDLKVAMRKMKLPVGYAKEFMQGSLWPWPAKVYEWPDFASLLQEKEPVIVELFNSLGVSKSGTVRSSHVKDSLVKVGLCASEDNVNAMMSFLSENSSDGLKYGQFRRFMLLLPAKQLSEDPWSVWLKAATVQGMSNFREDLRLPLVGYVPSVYRNFLNNDVSEGPLHERTW